MRNKPTVDLTGKRFGRWEVISYLGKSRWECKCDCGTVRSILSNQLITGHTKSCGCYRREVTIKRNTTHGMNKTVLHSRWLDMKDRCYNQNERSYVNYGARGIYVCDEWKNDFQAFYTWSMENGFDESLSLDRIDNDAPYAPWNCRWVDRATQNRNTRRNRFVTANGKTQTVMDWAIETGINEATIRHRLDLGWTDIDAVTKPPRPLNRRAG